MPAAPQATPSKLKRSRWLGRLLGPTWQAAPVRRVIQTVCLVLFGLLVLWVSWPYGSPEYVKTLGRKEQIPAELFLLLDPLVGLSAALAGKIWVVALAWAGVVILLSLWFPRGFCGYLCPLGTTIDVFDRLISRRIKRWQIREIGGWRNLKYYLLAATLISAGCGVLFTGYVSAIPVVTRGFQFILGNLELGLLKGWYLIPPANAGIYFSVLLFFIILGLGFLSPRFWCRYVCPSGALFSCFNQFRQQERKVTDACIDCGKCVPHCPFDAIRADFHTRFNDCTYCETCGGVCPTGAIVFTTRSNTTLINKLKDENIREIPLTRRGFMTATVTGLAGGLGIPLTAKGNEPLVRPPGSVPEKLFLETCVRCGLCYQACPNSVLQPAGFGHGWDALWTPEVVARWSGCEPKCANCGQVCPTGAIRPLPLEEKRVAHMGLAVLNLETCLPYAKRDACQLCYDECKAAGYDAIEFIRTGTELDASGNPVEGSGFLAPVIKAESCVGCGLCETRCYKINTVHKRLLPDTAIHVVAGIGKEDRIATGSYLGGDI